MKKLITSLTALFIVVAGMAQEDAQSLEIKAVSWQFGLYSGDAGVTNFGDFQKLAPDMELAESDLDGFSNGVSYFQNAGPAFSVNIVMAKPTAEQTSKLNPEFRFGVSFQRATLMSLNYTREDVFRIDTLQSSRNGSNFFVDSVENQRYALNYSQRQVMVDADVTISTNPAKRWKFSTGIGVSFGMSITPRTDIIYNSTTFLEGESDEDFDSDYEHDNETNQFSNKSGFFGRVYIPFIVDFRLGQKRESLRRYHLFIESRQSVNFQSISELSGKITVANVNAFGIRYEF